MMPIATPTFIRAIPKGTGYAASPGFALPPGEQFYDLTGLPWKDQNAVRQELDNCGFFVQDIYFSDPMPLQVGLEIRNRIKAEQEGKQ